VLIALHPRTIERAAAKRQRLHSLLLASVFDVTLPRPRA